MNDDDIYKSIINNDVEEFKQLLKNKQKITNFNKYREFLYFIDLGYNHFAQALVSDGKYNIEDYSFLLLNHSLKKNQIDIFNTLISSAKTTINFNTLFNIALESIKHNNYEIFKILINKKLINPISANNIFIISAFEHQRKNIISFLLTKNEVVDLLKKEDYNTYKKLISEIITKKIKEF